MDMHKLASINKATCEWQLCTDTPCSLHTVHAGLAMMYTKAFNIYNRHACQGARATPNIGYGQVYTYECQHTLQDTATIQPDRTADVHVLQCVKLDTCCH